MSGYSGIDFDTNEIHVVTIDEEERLPGSFASFDLATDKGDAFARARRVRDLLPARSRWSYAGILAVGLEDVYSKHLSSVVGHKRIEGAILACLPRDVAVYAIRPQHWKLAALGDGKGNADKDEVRAWASARSLELGGWPQGLLDAFAIAVATAEKYENAATRRQQRGVA